MRETRLLILVVVVSVAVLLLLAHFRFPDTTLSSVNVAPATGPLAGLAARATFDEMSATMSRLLGQVGPAVALVRFEPDPPQPPAGNGRGAAADGARGRGDGRVPAGTAPVLPLPQIVLAGIRVRSDLVLVYAPPAYHPVSTPDLAEPVDVIVTDVVRRVALIRAVPSPLSLEGLPAPVQNIGGFSFVGVVRPAAHGPTIQPVFIGRADAVPASEWTRPLFAIGADPGMPAGALVFALDGRFVGMAVPAESGAAIIPADALRDLASQFVVPRSPVQ